MSLASIAACDPVAAFAISKTLKLEGGLVDDPCDHGSVTSHGISLRFALQEIGADPSSCRWLDIDHDGHVDETDIRSLTSDEAADIYYQLIYRPGWYAHLTPKMVVWKCFDIGVNAGPKRASVILQKALSRVGVPVARVPGISPEIVKAVAQQAAKDQGEALLAAIRAEQRAYYERLVVLEPDLSRFLKGWLNRAVL